MQTRKKSNKGLIVLALLAVLWLLAGKKGAAGGTGATPSGTVGSVTVTQGYYAARAHLLPKRVGDTVTLAVSWSAATKNFLGEPIPWNYGISWRYRRAVTGDLRAGGFFNIGSRTNGSYVFGASDILDASFITGDWDVQVTLHADSSSPDGLPLNDMPALQDDALFIAGGEHLNAFRVV